MSRTVDDDEPDVVYLNVEERADDRRAEEAKALAWFRYGADMTDDLGIHYVAKVDPGAALNLQGLLRMMSMDLPSRPYRRRIYAGRPWADHKNKSVYMKSPFYVMSTDLARYVGYELMPVQREVLASDVDAEDLNMGRYIMSDPRTVMLVSFHNHIFWESLLNTEKEGVDHHEKFGTKILERQESFLPFTELCHRWKEGED